MAKTAFAPRDSACFASSCRASSRVAEIILVYPGCFPPRTARKQLTQLPPMLRVLTGFSRASVTKTHGAGKLNRPSQEQAAEVEQIHQRELGPQRAWAEVWEVEHRQIENPVGFAAVGAALLVGH